MRRPTVHDIARYFLTLQDEENADISNLKLQKLIYYAQGYSLALRGKPLFSDRIKAWGHGPVVPDVWHRYKEHGSLPIGRDVDVDPSIFDEAVRGLLDDVYAAYGQFSGWKLREMAHKEEPWVLAWERAQAGGPDEVSSDSMKTYFRRLVQAGASRVAHVAFANEDAQHAWRRVLEPPEALLSLQRGREDARAGRTRPWEEILARIPLS